ncbi:MAG: APC family permease [Liquorilactobacillus nagelii]|uniref:Amino acid permease n=1 Tax=Liquorilactobacillus nagelii TaxID=82688 RepID=A0A3Q8CBV9_9LACO|nr:APC family permease [Liquorilactobacillus nagelii]AUJ31876.1 amino acid permease [Liquorilactobacillus nagelii]MCC7615741.1 amino acid permease [Liquorilactobacillus nagelii]MCP9314047.1 APC family permease [Liquorilactobacillus nagelii]
MENSLTKKHFISWPVIAFLDFVTIIGFDDILYSLQNQGLSVVFTWIFMVFAFVIPYEMSVSQLGATFTGQEDGGLSSWVRHSTNDTLGYWTAWMYWAASLPYIVDVANSVIVSFSWLVLGNNSLGQRMSNFTFGLLTFIVILIFILLQNFFKRSMEVMATIGGGAMFLMTVLFVIMTGYSLAHGGQIATHPFNFSSFIPHFSLQYFSTTGLLMFAVCGAELVAPYLIKMRNPNRDFPKAMWLVAFMTAFLTVFGTFSLAIFFNANNLPHDLKMNGSYYAFQLLGQRLGMGNILLYIFTIVQAIYMMAQLAVLLDAASWVIAGDTAVNFMPRWLSKRNKNGRPLHSYVLTSGLCLFLLLMSGTFPNINSIFNWLLNLNGIVFPFKNCWIFLAFIAVRWQSDRFHSSFVFIKKKAVAIAVGVWCFIFSFVCALMSFIPQDVKFGTTAYDHQLLMNLFSVFVLFGVGMIMPLLARLEKRQQVPEEN